MQNSAKLNLPAFGQPGKLSLAKNRLYSLKSETTQIKEQQHGMATDEPKNQEENLIRLLTALNKIGENLTRLKPAGNLMATLQLIAENAVGAVTVSAATRGIHPNASAVIWVYDAAKDQFDAELRVSAGEPPGASNQDYPREDGLGRRAIRRQARILSYEERGQAIHPAKQAIGARFMVCYPLLADGEAVGLLYVYRCDEQPFNQISLLMLDNFVNLAALAIRYGRRVGGLTHRLERKVKEMETLHQTSHKISSKATLTEMLQEFLDTGLTLTAAQYGSFELYDKEKNRLVIQALAGRGPGASPAEPLPVDESSVVGWVASHKQSLRIGDLRQSEWHSIYQRLPADKEMRAELAVPLIGAGGSLEGVLNIESPRPHSFTEDDQHLLEAFATQAVVALQEMRLLDATQKFAEVLLRAEKDELLKLIVDQACALINVSGSTIWTIDEAEVVLQQATPGFRLERRARFKGSVTEEAIQKSRPVIIDDVRTDPRFQGYSTKFNEDWLMAMVVPLMLPNKRALGSISLYAAAPRDFSSWDKKLLVRLADHAAIAMQNLEGLAKLKRPSNLSQREQEVLELLIDGHSNKDIAEALTVSVNTVKKHLQGIYSKFNVESRAAAVAKALGRE